MSTVTPEMNSALDTTHTPDNNDKNIVSTNRSCAVTPEKSSVLNITHTPDYSNRRTVSLRRQINFVDYLQFCMFSNKTSCIESSQDVVETVNTLQHNKSGVKPDNNNESKPDNNDDSKRRPNKYVPNMSTIYTWDMYHQPLQKMLFTHICGI